MMDSPVWIAGVAILVVAVVIALVVRRSGRDQPPTSSAAPSKPKRVFASKEEEMDASGITVTGAAARQSELRR